MQHVDNHQLYDTMKTVDLSKIQKRNNNCTLTVQSNTIHQPDAYDLQSFQLHTKSSSLSTTHIANNNNDNKILSTYRIATVALFVVEIFHILGFQRRRRHNNSKSIAFLLNPTILKNVCVDNETNIFLA
jgi:hypothetical protein